MSLNLGNEAIAAARALRMEPNWGVIRERLGVTVMERMNAALDAAIENRVEATAYARALRDLWQAFESATLEIPQRQVERPKLRAGAAS